MLDIVKLAKMLEGTMTLEGEEDDYYLTEPETGITVADDGAVLLELSNGFKRLSTVPDGPLTEQACFVRDFIKKADIQSVNYTDDYKIYEECRRKQHANQEISHGTVRAVVTQYDDPFHAEVHEFVSTGAIMDEDLWHHIFGSLYNALNDEDKLAADMVGTYLLIRRKENNIHKIKDWQRKWIGE